MSVCSLRNEMLEVVLIKYSIYIQSMVDMPKVNRGTKKHSINSGSM